MTMTTTVQNNVLIVTSRELQKCVIIAGDEATLEQIQMAFEIVQAQSPVLVYLIPPDNSMVNQCLEEGWLESDRVPLLFKTR